MNLPTTTKEVFKIVRWRPGFPVPASMYVSRFHVFYPEGEWVEGIRGTPLMCFSHLGAAQRCRNSSGARNYCSIYRAEAEVYDVPPPRRLKPEKDIMDVNMLKLYWMDWESQGDGTLKYAPKVFIPPPFGTVMCKRVKLVEELRG